MRCSNCSPDHERVNGTWKPGKDGVVYEICGQLQLDNHDMNDTGHADNDNDGVHRKVFVLPGTET